MDEQAHIVADNIVFEYIISSQLSQHVVIDFFYSCQLCLIQKEHFVASWLEERRLLQDFQTAAHLHKGFCEDAHIPDPVRSMALKGIRHQWIGKYQRRPVYIDASVSKVQPAFPHHYRDLIVIPSAVRG